MWCKPNLPGNSVSSGEKDEPGGIPSVPHGSGYGPVTPAGDTPITG